MVSPTQLCWRYHNLPLRHLPFVTQPILWVISCGSICVEDYMILLKKFQFDGIGSSNWSLNCLFHPFAIYILINVAEILWSLILYAGSYLNIWHILQYCLSDMLQLLSCNIDRHFDSLKMPYVPQSWMINGGIYTRSYIIKPIPLK